MAFIGHHINPSLCTFLALIVSSIALPALPPTNQEPWKIVECTLETTSIDRPPAARWEASMADQAFASVSHRWNHGTSLPDGTPVSLNFVNTMMNMFRRPEVNCGLVTESCDFSALTCQDHNTPSPSPPHPAAYNILLSLGNFHAFHVNLYNSVGEAKDRLIDTMGSFVATFAPNAPEPGFIDKLFEGFAEAALDFALQGLLKPIGSSLENLAEDAKEAVTQGVETGMGILTEVAKAGGNVTAGLTPEQKKETLVETLAALVEGYRRGIHDYMTSMLSGSSTHLPQLASQFRNGNWLHGALHDDIFDLSTSLSQAFSALLISPAWKLADKTYPVILVRHERCFGGKPTDLMNDNVVHAGGSCIVPDKTMWLVSYTAKICHEIGSPSSCGPDNPYGCGSVPVPCEKDVFEKLPGWDDLQAKTGIINDAIVSSSWNAYVANGFKNGYKPDLAGQGVGGFKDGVWTAGLYQIPICDINEAMRNYRFNIGGNLCDYGGW